MSETEMRFDVRGEGSSTLEIDVYDVIGETWDGRGMSARKARGILRSNPDAKTIKLRVNSGGGSVIDGFAIYQNLAEHKAKVIADVDGLAASMASVIIMAADEIRIAPHAMVMIHNPWGGAIGEAEDMRKMADVLDKMRDGIAAAYVERTGKSRDEVVAMMDAETWMSAEEALEHGFVDQIKETKKPAANALSRLDLSGFGRVPSGFQAAVAKARTEAAQPAKTDSTAAVGGASNKENKMDLKELKAQHPEAFEAAVQEGVKQERGRVSAHLKLGQACGDVEIAIKAIRDGSSLTEELQAEYMAVGMKNAAIATRQAESNAAGVVADSAAPAPEDASGLNSKIKAMAEMTKGLLGQEVK